MKRTLIPVAALMLALIVSPLIAPVASRAGNDPVVVSPESVGLSSGRLDRIRPVMNRHVAEKRIPGAAGLIARQGKIAYQEAFGMADVEAGRPMRMDTIHRIYSMTKPITSVALMMLFEEGKFQLNDPVAKYLPEFAKMQVAIEEKDPQTGKPVMKTVPARRPITVRDLMRHTAGLTYGVFGDTLVDREYRKARILSQLNLADFVRDLAAIPLQYEPGTRWHYSVSVDVQGRLIEVLSGMPFDRFLQERIFTPLEMNDTAFVVPAGKKDRFARLYTITKEGKLAASPTCSSRQECFDAFPNAVPDFLSSMGMLSGGGGLTSTAYDYLNFCQMLLDQGVFKGKRLLGRKTVQLMSSDHLGSIPGMGPGTGFGLGFAVSKAPGEAGVMGSPGEFNWGGAAGTKFWIDPQEQLIGIFMIQILPHNGLEYGSEFRVMTYQAISD
ncbi:MAG: serine hydrolase domain-containing protein [Blastocatellales bacterium]